MYTNNEPSYIMHTCCNQLEFVETVLGYEQLEMSANAQYGLQAIVADINEKLKGVHEYIPDNLKKLRDDRRRGVDSFHPASTA